MRRCLRILDRKRGGVLYLLHRKARADIEKIHLLNQSFVELVISGYVPDDNAHQVVDVATHTIELYNLGKRIDGTRKRLEPFCAVLVGFDGDKHIDAEI